jgi:hypothetical protein
VEWLRAVLTVLGGAAAGGVTNRVAIWMLFHPRHPPTVAGLRLDWLQGAVPKNRERMARTIGETVGGRLLTSRDLAGALASDDLESAFRHRLRRALRRAFREEHPAPAELLPAEALEELGDLLESLLTGLRPRAARWLASREFADGAGAALEELAEILDREAPAPVDPESVSDARRRVDGWLEGLARSDAFRTTVRRELDRAARELLRPGRSLEEILPRGVVSALEGAVRGYLPLAMGRLGRLLEDPDARKRFQAAVDELLERFMRDLRFHQRVVARLVITQETVEQVVDTLEEEGTERLGELLREKEVQAAMARSVSDAVADLLRRPATEVLGAPGDPRIERALDAAADWLTGAARSEAARAFLLDRIEEAALRAEDATWADLLRRLPADRVGPWLAAFLRSDAGRAAAEEAASRGVRALLHRPVGAPGRALGEGAADRLADLLAPALWDWIVREIPSIAEQVPVARKVEQKIRDFPMDEVEALVRSVTQRELDLIVRLGYLLGAAIGGILVLVNSLTV